MRTSNKNYNHFWKTVIRTQYHMNSTDVMNTLSEGGGSWGHGMQEARVKKSVSSSRDNLVETQYYGGYHADLTVGYVKNRTFNIKTNNCNTNELSNYPNNIISISQGDVKLNNKLKIISLKNLTHYYVDWYSYNTGNYIKTDYKKASFNGNLKLKFPALTGDNPVVWYVVHQNAYSGLIQSDPLLVENNRIFYDFQPIENDTTSINFDNAIFPNPFDKQIIVHSLTEDNFVLTTLTGCVIVKQNICKGINKIDIQELPKGIYFGKLIKQYFVIKLEKL